MQNKQMLWLLHLQEMLTFASIATELSPNPPKQSWIWASDLTCLCILQPTTDPSQTHKKHLHQVTHLCPKDQNIVSSKRCRIAPCCIWPSASLNTCSFIIPHSRLLSVWFLSDYALCLEISEMASKLRFSRNHFHSWLPLSFVCLSLFLSFLLAVLLSTNLLLDGWLTVYWL